MKIPFNTVTKRFPILQSMEDDDNSYQLQENEVFIEMFSDTFKKYWCLEDRINEIKNQKLMEIGYRYSLLEQAGYTNTMFNITLGYSDNDRNMFNQLLTMINLANDLGESIDSVPIADINNKVHNFTLVNLKFLLLQYGIAYQILWAKYSAKREEVLNETDPYILIELEWVD